MEQYSFEEVKRMSFAQLGAVEDPMDLMTTGFASPMLVRYVVRTGQLDERYPNIALPELLDVINEAAAVVQWSPEVGQRAPMAKRDPIVDQYLDALAPRLQSALHPD
ncbi:hypothetical protein P5W99_37690 [Paraburkholderia sp. A3BS-1L]|uniref:hypothetical protein n=1 Tax=Paraburkholderia sp. A3BS-1L TaxID=3028375 RepID=UPI003DA8C3E7